jgi:hypothetical protein
MIGNGTVLLSPYQLPPAHRQMRPGTPGPAGDCCRRRDSGLPICAIEPRQGRPSMLIEDFRLRERVPGRRAASGIA